MNQGAQLSVVTVILAFPGDGFLSLLFVLLLLAAVFALAAAAAAVSCPRLSLRMCRTTAVALKACCNE